MADIKQYRMEKNDGYESRLQKHRAKVMKTIMAAIGVIFVIVIVIIIINNKSTYSSYKVENKIRRDDGGYAEYVPFGNEILRCSKDGIASHSYSGKTLWNSTYEVNEFTMSMSGNNLAVADIGGSKIYTFNTNGMIESINTALPVLQISVSKAGYVAAVLEDKNVEYINMYSMKGEKIYTIKKAIDIDGLPVSISISEDGEKLVAAFTGIKDGNIKSSVVFYNFNEVGQNENERVVGGFDYGSTIVGRVEFLNATTVVAYGENKVSLYHINEYPELIKDIEVDYNIDKVFSGESYIGLVHRDKTEAKDIIEVYNTSGNKIFTKTSDKNYIHYKIADSRIIMYNEKECVIYSTNGKIKFEYTFQDGISSFIPLDKDNEYIYINKDYIRKIKLR